MNKRKRKNDGWYRIFHLFSFSISYLSHCFRSVVLSSLFDAINYRLCLFLRIYYPPLRISLISFFYLAVLIAIIDGALAQFALSICICSVICKHVFIYFMWVYLVILLPLSSANNIFNLSLKCSKIGSKKSEMHTKLQKRSNDEYWSLTSPIIYIIFIFESDQ